MFLLTTKQIKSILQAIKYFNIIILGGWIEFIV